MTAAPWTRPRRESLQIFLSPIDQDACVNDVLAAARASFATNQPHLVIAELTAWRETATTIAAGLGKEPVEWLDDFEAVERP